MNDPGGYRNALNDECHTLQLSSLNTSLHSFTYIQKNNFNHT